MAVTTDKPRAKPRPATKPTAAKRPAKAHKPSGRSGPSPVRTAKAKAARSAAHAAVSPGAPGSKLARKMATGALLRTGKRAIVSGTALAHSATERLLDATSTATSPGGHRRPPIQSGVDVAVPAHVAWEEWTALEWLPDAAGEISGLRRGRNGELRGKVRGERWSAEITEVHPPHSFAWRATRGTDCAGLITFHPLSEWLTRIELSLDVRPLAIGPALALAGHRADRRIAAELRRFKARLEMISPDEYGDQD